MNDGGDEFGNGLAGKEAPADLGGGDGNQGIVHHGVGQGIDPQRRNRSGPVP